MKNATIALLLAASAGLLQAQNSSFQGPYVGLNLGHGWGKADASFYALPDPATFINLRTTTVKPDPKGAIAGAQLGYNWQMGTLIFGLEGDASWSDMCATKQLSPFIQNDGSPFPGAGHLAAGQDTNWFSTLRGRIGFLPSNGWLLYFTAGGAVADVKYSATLDARPVGTIQYPVSFSKTKLGWTAGVGSEWTLSDNWSAKAEYLYYDLGRETRTVQPVPDNPPFAVKNTWDTKA